MTPIKKPAFYYVEYLEDHPTRGVKTIEKWISDWMHTEFKSKVYRSMMLSWEALYRNPNGDKMRVPQESH